MKRTSRIRSLAMLLGTAILGTSNNTEAPVCSGSGSSECGKNEIDDLLDESIDHSYDNINRGNSELHSQFENELDDLFDETSAAVHNNHDPSDETMDQESEKLSQGELNKRWGENFHAAQNRRRSIETPKSKEHSQARVQNSEAISPDVEWCRRNPTWRAKFDQLQTNPFLAKMETERFREKCQKILNHPFDPDYLARTKAVGLSSSYDFDDNSEYLFSLSWEDDETYFELPVMERPLLAEVAWCMDYQLEEYKSNVKSDGATEKTNIEQPTISQAYRRQKDGLVVMAVVENAIGQEEAAAVLALSSCMAEVVPYSNEQRHFEDTEEGGGNEVTFLAGFLQLLAPGVAHRIRDTAHMVWSTVGWKDNENYGRFEPVDVEHARYKRCELAKNWVPEDWLPTSNYSTAWFPDPLDESIGIRTTEHLSYDLWGSLGFHEDSGSDYTILVALSDPEDYEGGHFSLCPEEYEKVKYDGGKDCLNKISVKPNKFSAIVFLSNTNHGVEDIKSPGRVMFANELWRYGDAPAMVQRPDEYEFVLGWGRKGDDDDDDDDDDEYNDDEDDDGYDDNEDDDDGEDSDDEDDSHDALNRSPSSARPLVGPERMRIEDQ